MNFSKSLIAVIVVGNLTGCGSDSDNPVVAAPDPWLVSSWYASGDNNRSDVDPVLGGDGQPGVNSPVLQDSAYLINLGGKFIANDYIGAFSQDNNQNWTADWTVGLNGNSFVWAPASVVGALAGGTPIADDICPVGTTDIGNQTLPADIGGGSMDICELSARYTVNVSLSNDNVYELAPGFPGTKIGNGDAADGNNSNDISVTLSIEAGTLIIGETQEALIITRGASINAQGSSNDPIVMTSRTQFDNWVINGDATSGRGEWAGLALMGYAKTNECGNPCDVAAEGDIGAYGGINDSDSSGTLKYIVIRHAGNDLNGNGNEQLNGLTLFGTGSGTNMDYIQVHKNLGDGVEHFGSSDFMSHLVLTDNQGNSFDWGQGYTGGAQFIIIKQASDIADRGIEADNDKANPEATPVSMPTLANMTMIGDSNGDSGAQGILLRRGTGVKIWNTIVTNFAKNCIDLDDAATFNRAGPNAPGLLTGDLIMHNSIVNCVTNFDEE